MSTIPTGVHTLLSREDLSWRDEEGNAIDIPLATTGITRLRFSCKAD